MADLQTRLDALEQRTHTVERQLRWWRGATLLLVGLGLVYLPLQVGHTQGPDAVTAQALTLEQRVAALEAKLKYLTTRIDSSGRPLMEVAGANVRIVNGQGATETANGLGNLIVGYNELRPQGFENIRMGSHNVIVGKGHNYSRFGGLVVGFFHEISGNFAVVSGGAGNTASGKFSAVSGGGSNTASGEQSAVSGGNQNIASGVLASVSGGHQNIASGSESSVSGGNFNTARGGVSVVSGGELNEANGDIASVSGGELNKANGIWSSVSGGQNRTAAGEWDWVAGSLVEDD